MRRPIAVLAVLLSILQCGLVQADTRVVLGATTRASYIASVGAQATSAAITLSIESSATQGFKVTKICVSGSVATAAAAVNVTVQRTTTASSAGTALTAEGTGTTAISKMDPSSSNYGGIARLAGTPGASGAMLDQWGYTAGEVGAGAADPPSQPTYCKTYTDDGAQAPTVSAGVTNGIIITVSTHGAGGLADGAISATLITDGTP